jgi:hypothetical protein
MSWIEHAERALQLVTLSHLKAVTSGQGGVCGLEALEVWKPAAKAAASR